MDRPSHRLRQAQADQPGQALALRIAAAQQLLHAERHQHAVDGLASAEAPQQVQEARPCGTVLCRVAFLRGVAAGGVQQHGLVGEPPVAVARAADATDRRLAELGGQRKVEARVDQRRGLARTRRADDEVPGQLVDVAPRQAPEPPLLRLSETRLAQDIDRLLEALLEFGHLFLAGAGLGSGGIRRPDAGQAAQQACVHLLGTPPTDEQAQEPDAEQRGDDPAAHRLAFEGLIGLDIDQRTDEPDQQAEQHQAAQHQRDPVEEERKDLAQHVLVLRCAGSGRAGGSRAGGQLRWHRGPGAEPAARSPPAGSAPGPPACCWGRPGRSRHGLRPSPGIRR